MKKILVIEDDKILLKTISNLLQLEGFEPISAVNGRDGVRQALELMPDLIICDIMMPEKDGLQVLKEIRKSKKTQLVPFIFLTAKAELKEIRIGMQMGADDYITKPFDNDDLINSVNLRLQKQKLLLNKGLESINYDEKDKGHNTDIIKSLTKREKQIIREMCKGLSCRQISEELDISSHTVDSHRKNIEKKLKVNNITSVVRFAFENGLS
jgi:DNA-binding NarL/FixJ family response regulator